MIRALLFALLTLGWLAPAAAQGFDQPPRNSYDPPNWQQQQRPRPNVPPRPAPGPGMGGGQWQRPPVVQQRPPVVQQRPRWQEDRRGGWERGPGFRDRDWRDRDWDRPRRPDYGYVPPRPRVRVGQVCVTSRGSCWTRPAPFQSPCRCDIPGFGRKRGAVLR